MGMPPSRLPTGLPTDLTLIFQTRWALPPIGCLPKCLPMGLIFQN